MSYPRETLEERARELATYRITGKLRDEFEQPLQPGNLTAMTLTLFDETSRAIINNVTDVPILNVDRGNVDGGGNFTLVLQPADNPILNDSLLEEAHIAFVEWSYAAGLKRGGIEIELFVWNFVKSP